MIRNTQLFIFFLFSLQVFPQKVPVSVIRNSRYTEWEILDESYRQVFAGSTVFKTDTIIFSLESSKRYFLSVSVNESTVKDSLLLTLILDKEPLLLVTTAIDPGDHFLPFFTGVRTQETKITGGTTALISDFPWQVYITSSAGGCGGSIIAENWILTAAHCMRNDNGTTVTPSTVFVRAGLNNPRNSSDGTTYRAAQVIVHENYNTTTLANDLALIRLTADINTPNAIPIKLVTPTDETYGATDPGVMTWVTGWGLTSVTPEVFPTSLQKVQLPIITNQQASVVWRSIPNTVLMAGYLNGNKDACNGDSGGPMVVPVVGEYKLAGVVSWGSQDCDTYGGYTRVALFGSWISSKTGIPQIYRPPAPSGDTLICQGQTTTQYTMSQVTGADSFEWSVVPSGAGTVTGNINSATVVWNSGFTGVASLIYRVTVGGEVSDWSRLDIRVARNTRLLSYSRDTTICENAAINLNVNAEGYNLFYKWFKNGVLIKQGVSDEVFIYPALPANSGDYRVEISGACGTLTSPELTLSVLPETKVTPITGELSVLIGSIATLQTSVEGHNLVFNWLKDGIPVTGETSSSLIIQNINASDIGNYRLYARGTCGTVISDSIWLFVEGVKGTGAPDVFVWPSLITDRFNVAVSTDDLYHVRIFSTTGKLIKKYLNLRYRNEILISDLPGGMYIISVEAQDFSNAVKIIKTE